jgi:hypothetical protein
MPDDLDAEIAWWKAAAERQRHVEVQMVCWGIATGLMMAKADYGARNLPSVGINPVISEPCSEGAT